MLAPISGFSGFSRNISALQSRIRPLGTELKRWSSGDFLTQIILNASFPEESDGAPAPTPTQWSGQRRSLTKAGCGWSQW